MTPIIRGIDDIVLRLQIEKSDGTEFCLTDFDNFEVAVFTTDTATCYVVEPEYIDTVDNLVRIPGEKLLLNNSAVRAYLQDGIVRLILTTSLTDSRFPDGDYTQTNIVNTPYYLKTITD